MENTEWIGTAEAAILLNRSRSTVTRMVDAGKLSGVKAPGGLRAPLMLRRDEVEALAAETDLGVAS